MNGNDFGQIGGLVGACADALESGPCVIGCTAISFALLLLLFLASVGLNIYLIWWR